MNINVVQIVLIVGGGGLPSIRIWIIASLIAASKNVIVAVKCVGALEGDRGIERYPTGGKQASSADAVRYPVCVSASSGGQNSTLDVKSTGVSVKSSATA
jgi:hypothetical protein